jgi:hypothetical protein
MMSLNGTERKRVSRENVDYRRLEREADNIARREKRKSPEVLAHEAASKRQRQIDAGNVLKRTLKKEKNKEYNRRKKLPGNLLILEDLGKSERVNAGSYYPRRTDIIRLLGEIEGKGESFNDCRELVSNGLLERLIQVYRKFGSVDNNSIDNHVVCSLLRVLHMVLVPADWFELAREEAIRSGWLMGLMSILKAALLSVNECMMYDCLRLLSKLLSGESVVKTIIHEVALLCNIIKCYGKNTNCAIAGAACLVLNYIAHHASLPHNEDYCSCAVDVLTQIPLTGPYRVSTTVNVIRLVRTLVNNEDSCLYLKQRGIVSLLEPYSECTRGIRDDTRYVLGVDYATSTLRYIQSLARK